MLELAIILFALDWASPRVLATNLTYTTPSVTFLDSRNVESYCANDTEIIDHILYDTQLHYNRHKIPADPVHVRIEVIAQFCYDTPL